ncbi:MAG: DUF3048 domain-containing protein [Clostridia bacterium]
MKHKPLLQGVLLCVGFLVLLFAISFSSGCTNTPAATTAPATSSPVPTPAPTAVPTPTPVPTPPNGFIIPKADVRPIAVMVDNQGSRPLPQGGLKKAQIVYECLAEGGITRLMPVFWGTTPSMVGPVRSSRHYFAEFAYEHDAIYVHIGWSPQARAIINSLGIADVNGLYDKAFWKLTNDRSNWQDKYTSYDKIIAIANSKNFDLKTKEPRSFLYSQIIRPLTGKGLKKAKVVGIRYNSQADNRYVYNPKTKLYMRYRNGAKHMDRASGKQLSTGNIVVQFVSNYGIIGDYKNRQELQNIGSGKGWYITCGKAVEIRWKKTSASAKTRYTRLSGKPLVLNPAQTWIQVVPPSVPIVMK